MPLLNPTASPLRGDPLFQALGKPSERGVTVWRLDGAGVAIQSAGSLCYIDPFLADGGQPGWIRRQPKLLDRLPPPSLVLLTHEHDDHADPVALKLLAQTSCLLAGPAPAVEVARSAGFLQRRTIVLTVGMQFQLGELTVTASRVRDDDAKAPLAYLVSVSGITLYHGGDAQMSSAFDDTGAAFTVTVACLSSAGKLDGKQFYLTPKESVTAAQSLRAKTLIPIHWDLWTINGLPRAAWDDILQSASRNQQPPTIAMLDPGGRLDFP